MLDTALRLRMLTSDLPKSLERIASQPQIAREREEYLEQIGDISSIDEFLNNDRVYAFAMKASGLEEMIYAKGFMRKVLEEGIDSKDAFANRLTDERYREFAETFNFARYGETTMAFSRTQEGIADKYVRYALETEEGTDNQGVRLALYFERKAASITDPMEFLADEALAEVARTLAGIPEEAATASLDWQAARIGEKINVEDLQDPEKLAVMLERFAALWDMNNPASAPVVPNVLINDPMAAGIGQDILMSLQGLRLGGN